MNKHTDVLGLNRAGALFPVAARPAICSKFRTTFSTLLLAATLAVVSLPGRASDQSIEVWLYAPGGGAYDAVGYSVGGGHVSDPVGEEIAIVDGQGNVYDIDSGALIGYIVVVGA